MEVKTRAVLSDFDNRGLGMRQSGSDLQAVIEKGHCISAERGEYEGVNASAELLTEGHTRRVFLHSLFEHPHTTCSCFQCVAFYIKEVDGIGLMDRGFRGAAPYGWSWDDVANAAAGKQSSGYAAFGRDYLKSIKFLQADGGWQRVVWMSQELKEKFAPDKGWVATEVDVSNLEELIEFVKAKRG